MDELKTAFDFCRNCKRMGDCMGAPADFEVSEEQMVGCYKPKELVC